jgi:hypothetical protein
MLLLRIQFSNSNTLQVHHSAIRNRASLEFVVIPAKAGIQYAARLSSSSAPMDTGSSAFADDDGGGRSVA